MMRTWLLTILVCLAVFPAAAQQDCIPVHPIDQEHLAFKSGEVLNLVLHYKWGAINSDVGKASITIDSTSVDGVSCYHIKLSARTARFYDVFFKVREGFESWVTCDGLRPVRFKRDTQENTYRATNNYVYCWDTDEPYVEANVFTSSIGAKLLALPVNSCTFDLPALFMVARNADFSRIEKGVPYPMSFLIDDDRFRARNSRSKWWPENCFPAKKTFICGFPTTGTAFPFGSKRRSRSGTSADGWNGSRVRGTL